MGEANNRKPEIDAKVAAANHQQQQIQMLAFMTQKEAIFTSGVYINTAGRMIRLAFVEQVMPQVPAQVRAAIVMQPEDFEKFVDSGVGLVKQFRDQGVLPPVGTATITKGDPTIELNDAGDAPSSVN